MSRRMRRPLCVLSAIALTVTALSAQSPAVKPPASPSGSSRVVGRVMSTGSEALANALVTLLLFTDNRAASSRWTATTGADGAFDFQSLPAGRYRAVAERPGYSGIEVTATGLRSIGSDFTLAESDVANVDLVLQRAGGISGRVTQPDGTPAAEAQVMASIRVETPANQVVGLRAPVRADADGRYHIADVPPGSFLVRAVVAAPPDRRTSVATLFPSMLEYEAGEPVVVAAGSTTEGIDIRLRSAAPAFRVSGRVVDAQGRIPRSAEITFADMEGKRGGSLKVAADGGFAITPGFEAGATVVVLANGESEQGPVAGVGTVAVGTGASEMEPIVLRTPGAIVGRLVAPGPLPDAMTPRIRAQHELFRFPPTTQNRAQGVAIASDGAFRLDGVIGRQQLVVQPLPPTWGIVTVRHRGTVLAGGIVSVDSAQVIDGIEVVVGPRTP